MTREELRKLAAAFLQEMGPTLGQAERAAELAQAFLEADDERERLSDMVNRLNGALTMTSQHNFNVRQENETLRAENVALKHAERVGTRGPGLLALRKENDTLRAELEKRTAELREAGAERDKLRALNDALIFVRDALTTERDEWEDTAQALERLEANAQAELEKANAEIARVRGLTTDAPDHGNEYAIVCHYKNELAERTDELEKRTAERDEARAEAEKFRNGFENERRANEHYRLQVEREHLLDRQVADYEEALRPFSKMLAWPELATHARAAPKQAIVRGWHEITGELLEVSAGDFSKASEALDRWSGKEGEKT